MISQIVRVVLICLWIYFTCGIVLPRFLKEAYDIRMMAIDGYGPIIHEFDPYFNYRATEYLYEHGWKNFVTWFDYKVWYPLGRPVGTTIYPGMQVTAVWIKNHIFGDKMSLNDICCYIPSWFGVIATLLTGLLAYECSLPTVTTHKDCKDLSFGSVLESIPVIGLVYKKAFVPFVQFLVKQLEFITGTDMGFRQKYSRKLPYFVDVSSPALECGLFAAGFMAIVPAHLLRSIGGGYDNESIAVTAMVLTFLLWTRSLRGDRSNTVKIEVYIWGALAGVAYFYMVAVWGGYVFVLNLIGCHAATLVLLGRYSTKLHRAYSMFYIVGTILAIQVPVVGWAPLKSLEQMGPLLVFVGFQAIEYVEYMKRKKGLSRLESWKLRFKVFGLLSFVMILIAYLLVPTGYFGPISARVRGLFVKHTKTGNPLVDSVAEHQPASPEAYKQYLDFMVYLSPIGFMMVAFLFFHDSSSFLLVYGMATYFFSSKMVRLILLTAPIASSLSGIFCGRLLGFFLYNIFGFTFSLSDLVFPSEDSNTKHEEKPKNDLVGGNEKRKKSNNKAKNENDQGKISGIRQLFIFGRSMIMKIASLFCLYTTAQFFQPEISHFYDKSRSLAKSMSHPTIVMKGRLKDSDEVVLIDDYRDCYNWIRKNTPEDSRILAWWDYGYQITAIANRTTIADGNTWNHEHIALLGRILTGPAKEGHRIARHLADYVFLWTGGGGDDLAKSPHLARIANSVYRNMCPGDPMCSSFGYTQNGAPSKMMKESFLYQLHSHRMKPGVVADPNRFQEVYNSRFGKCRVFKILSVSQESKEWIANPANRICDANGSWFCRGQYPPALNKILAEKKDFSQLEDFNKKENDDSEYQKKYFETLHNKMSAPEPTTEPTQKKPWNPKILSSDIIEKMNAKWDDNPTTTYVWKLITDRDAKGLVSLLTEYPELAHIRSSDGRGPMWWAYEVGDERLIRILKKVGVSDTLKDASGRTAISLRKPNSEL